MKSAANGFLSLLTLITGFSLVAAGRLNAQSFTTLHHFTGGSGGANPWAGMVLSGNTLYGTTRAGNGISGRGTVFAINTDGTGFTNLYSFSATSGSLGTNSDGAEPVAGLILSGSMLYGTAYQGGTSGRGTVFAVSTNGSGFATLHSFTANPYPSNTNSDGASPYGGLVLSGNTLYGTAQYGGASGNGTVFAIHTDGTGFTNLHSFTAGSGGLSTNSDGAIPQASLILSGNTLFGMAHSGGGFGNGTVFALNTNGTGFTTLHSFAGGSGGSSPVFARLFLSGAILYGSLAGDGAFGGGTIFAVNTNGTGFTNLYHFTAVSNTFPYGNKDGAYPWAGVIVSGDTAYGTTEGGGTSGNGAVFTVYTDGTDFANLHNFSFIPESSPSTNGDGAFPSGGLVLLSSNLYGTTFEGGASGNGTIFRISLPPPRLTIVSSGPNVILTWRTNFGEFSLQSTTNLGSPSAWDPVSPAPIILNGRNTVTNPTSGTRRFYRLSQ